MCKKSGLRRKKKYFSFLSIVGLCIFFMSSSPPLQATPKLFLQSVLPPDSTNQTDTSSVNLIFPFSDNTGSPYLDNQAQSPLFLHDPPNIQREIIYDPVTNTYEFQSKIGDFQYRPPTEMSFEEYQQYNNDRSIKDYWNERAKSAGTAEGSRLIPKIYIGGKAFDKIFGSNTIDIRPQGSAEVSFGVLSNRRDDPALDERQRSTTNFDFDMKIQMNVIAKIGDKIEFKANYNTESSFDFENTLKLKYEGDEDEIIQLIEAGNVSLPLNSSLIRGSQSLFGIKTELKFGKTTVTGIFSQQQSETQNITVEGGAQTNNFQMTALDYEANKHFFLNHFFRDNYERALSDLPIITSDLNITKLEVWVTNIGSATQENRSIVAFTDLGEGDPATIFNPLINPDNFRAFPPSNYSNDMLARMDTSQIRDINSVTRYLTDDPLHVGQSGYFVSGEDFVKLENARKLRASEFSINTKLGFISLNTSLNPDQVLAVAVQYTVIGRDEVYQIGEFSDQGIAAPNCLTVKLLKSSALNTKMPMWDLMMKNVYAIGAYQVERNNFVFNVLYSGDRNGVPTGYFMEGPAEVQGVPLIHLLGLDNLDMQNNPIPGGDGMFDFVDRAATSGGTFQSTNGRLFFTKLEPFGSYLRETIFPNNPDLADHYAFDSLYTLTKTGAEQYPEKNKFILEGFYKSSAGSDISLNALNVPQGSVKVTASGVPLTENVDYTVDYTLGRVKIINEGILNSGTPINVSLESNSMFNVQQKTLMGMHIDHEIQKDFHMGGTILNLSERPLTQKVNYGDDPINNTIWGLDLSYRTESRWLTKMIDKLPGISTKQISKINVDAEFAHFIPGHSSAIGNSGTSYIDDFEGAKSSIDLKHAASWFLASTPQHQYDLFPETKASSGLNYGKNRAKMAWYIIDPLFYDRSGSLRPGNVDKNEMSNNLVRQVLEREVFPEKENPTNVPTNIAVLNLAYYPEERGPYNYDGSNGSEFSAGVNPDGTLAYPGTRWGGIMRKIESSDFEAANIEYIEFWMMDPFVDDTLEKNTGKLYINLGDVSEDILRDGRKSYENGLPTTAVPENVDETEWGRVPTLQALVESFSGEPDSRAYQDVGYEGLGDEDERQFHAAFLSDLQSTLTSEAFEEIRTDPSADNYHYYRGSDYDQNARFGSILERYKYYNGPDGNSPTDALNPENYPTAGTNLPNVEDLNRDNTLNESERYFQYMIELDPEKMVVGENFITDIRKGTPQRPNNDKTPTNWYQFKIPVQNPEKIVGKITDFRSIRFMRLFMKDFEKTKVLRFATFELVRGEWRRYKHPITSAGEYVTTDEGNETNFVVSTVNTDENAGRNPVSYVLPPGIRQETNFATTQYIQMNEQSLQLTVTDLLDGEAKGVYKTTDFDFRQYKKLKMYVHAEKQFEEQSNPDYGDMTVFIRVGSDFTDNYYEYELPLEFTQWNSLTERITDPELVWPAANRMEIVLDELVQVKHNRNIAMRDPQSDIALYKPYVEYVNGARVTVKGSPSISDVKGILIGVRNPKKRGIGSNDDGNPKSAIVWINELRLTDFNKKPGWATTGRLEAQLADLGKVVLSGAYSSAGFGSIEKKISEISLDDMASWSIATDIDWGKFLPEKSGIRVPMHVDYNVGKITPKYNPLDPDIVLQEDLDTYVSPAKRDSVKHAIEDYTVRTNVNFMNIRKDRVDNQAKPKVYDIENFDVSFAYTHDYHRDVDIEYDDHKSYRGNIGYNFNNRPKNFVPLSKVRSLNSKYLALIKDFNFYLLPKMLSIRFDMDRDYTERLYRDKSFGDIITYPNYNRTWNWNRKYDFKYDLAKSLTIDFSAGANAYIYEPNIFDKSKPDWERYQDTVWSEILSMGTMQRYNQSIKINYNVPLKKIPFLDWTTMAASYGTNYTWAGGSRYERERFGNTIENARQIQINSNADMDQLYGKVPYLKTLIKSASKSRRGGPKPRGGTTKEPEVVQDSTKSKVNYGKIIGEGFLKILLSLKKASVTYSRGEGMMLPGYMPAPELFGMNLGTSSPGLGFIMGDQSDIRQKATNKGWVTDDPALNNAYMTKFNEIFNYKVNADILGAIRIDVDGDRAYTSNFSSYYRFDTVMDAFMESTPVRTGNLSISYSIIKTSFSKAGSNESSPVFEEFLNNRNIIANRLAEQNPYWDKDHFGYYEDTLAGAMFPVGYGSNSQEVLYYSFLAAYSGTNAGNIKVSSPFPSFPIPNWRITFNGLTQIKAVEKLFRSVNITHAYRSMLSINSWRTNVQFDPANPVLPYDNGDNFVPEFDIGVVSIIEQYTPLIGLDVTMHNSLSARAEYKKSRNLSLSFVNNQLTEIVSNEVVIGLGYRMKNLSFSFSSMTGGGKKNNFKSDLNLKLDFGIRDNKTTLRRIDEINNQVSAGQKQYTVNFSSDYMLSQSLQLRAYFNWTSSNPYISSQFPNATTSGGFTLRFNLAQ